MKPKARFIKSVIAAAKECQTDMPWARQPRQGKAAPARNRARLA